MYQACVYILALVALHIYSTVPGHRLRLLFSCLYSTLFIFTYSCPFICILSDPINNCCFNTEIFLHGVNKVYLILSYLMPG